MVGPSAAARTQLLLVLFVAFFHIGEPLELLTAFELDGLSCDLLRDRTVLIAQFLVAEHTLQFWLETTLSNSVLRGQESVGELLAGQLVVGGG